MKTLIFTLIILLAPPILLAQTGGHFINPYDSLLFDGDGSIMPYEPQSYGPCDSSECLIKVTRMEKGFIRAWRCKKEKGLLCGVKEVEGYVMRPVNLNVGDYVHPGDSIEVTGKNAEFSLSWYETGSIIEEQFTVKFRSSQSWVVPKDFCEKNKEFDYENSHLKDILRLPLRFPGLMWLGIKRLAGAPDFQVETERAVTGPRGTIFSVEFIGGDEVVKVFEGSVEIKPKKFKISANEEMAKLSQDYQAGKITMEEYTKRAMELAPQIKDEAVNVSKKIIVEAGYQVTVGDGMVSEITPLTADEDKWWEK